MDDKTKVKHLTQAWAVLMKVKNHERVPQIVVEDACNKIDEVIQDIVKQGLE